MGGQRRALIVANDEYEHEGLQNLLAPTADAEALGRVLGDPRIGNFAVDVMRNETAHVIAGRVDDLFAESRPDDVLLLHFSCHGLKDESGELFFAASNTRPDRLRSTSVAADFVHQCMRSSRSRGVVLLLDCCYGGAFASGTTVRAAGDVKVLDSFPQDRSGGGRSSAVITATSSMEYAFEGDHLADGLHLRPSVFTGALVDGLVTGDADRNEDGWISLDELYEYLFDKVREQNPHQTPTCQLNLQGELHLARSLRRRIHPMPIPADLQAAVSDSNMYTRLGAVSELRTRLLGNNLPAAAGAFEVLTDLARTASQYLADSAAAALREAAVQPARTELHFGQVEQGSPRPHRIVQLGGPPLARACVLRPSGDWIHVDQAGDALDISIETTGVGAFSGRLDLKTPTGEAVIAVEADLIPRPATEPAEIPVTPAGAVRAAKASLPGHERALPVSEPARPPETQGRAVVAGLVVLIISGICEIIQYVFLPPVNSRSYLHLVLYVGGTVLAFAALFLRKRRNLFIGLLQGLWLPLVAELIWSAVEIGVDHFFSADRHVVVAYISFGGYLLGAMGLILLLPGWMRCAERRQVRSRNYLQISIIVGAGISQFANSMLFFTPAGNAAQITYGATIIVIGVAVAWYATSLRSRTLGSLLMLGWSAATFSYLLANMTSWSGFTSVQRDSSIIAVVTLFAVMILAGVYLHRRLAESTGRRARRTRTTLIRN
jgi:hypothetical protein